jgi:AraC family transcriptional regulator of adaptative response / DNA-3-methyladenine glycosylase II
MTMRLPGGAGIASLAPLPDHVSCQLLLDDVRDLTTAIARCRRLLDLDADPEAVDASLAEDPVLAPWVAKAPGRRLPRCTDGDEMALRVVLGQQVSLGAARTHARRLAERYGEPATDPEGSLTLRFPSIERLAELDPEELAANALSGPESRRRCFTDVVSALASGSIDLGPGGDWERARAQLTRISGIGGWSAEMIAMRALGDPDAFPSSDVGVRRGARSMGLADRGSDLAAAAQRWRPWRSYAVQHLWAAAGGPATEWPPGESPTTDRTAARLPSPGEEQ